MKIKLQKYARQDLREIYNYIFIDSPYYANITKNKILNRIMDLSTFPYLGRKVQIFNDYNIRELIYKSYRIIYEIDSNIIYIHRIFHSARLFNKSNLKIKSK